jgi:uncharacterized membrane protein
MMRLGELNGAGLAKLMGNMHPAIVHFPIALVTVAAVLELLQIVRRKPGLSAATPACLVLGGLSAIVAAAFGWLSADAVSDSPDATNIHRWVGIGATVVAVLAMLVLVKAVTPNPGEARGAIISLRLLVLIGAAVIGGAGFLGAEISFGKDHMFRGVFPATKPPGTLHPAGDPPPIQPGISHDKVDFVNDVAPVLKDTCLRCHGGDKVKGKFNMKTKAGCFKGGENCGPGIVAGNPEKSSVYSLLVTQDEGDRMPPPKEPKQLTDKQKDIIKKWIEQGAVWPDGAEL